MAILPTIFVGIVTLPQGVARWREYLRYLELEQKLRLRSMAALCLPLWILGIVSAWKIAF